MLKSEFGYLNTKQLRYRAVVSSPVNFKNLFSSSYFSLLYFSTWLRQVSGNHTQNTRFLPAWAEWAICRKGRKASIDESTFIYLCGHYWAPSQGKFWGRGFQGLPCLANIVTFPAFSFLFTPFSTQPDYCDSLSLTFIFNLHCFPFWTSCSCQCSLLIIPWVPNFLLPKLC